MLSPEFPLAFADPPVIIASSEVPLMDLRQVGSRAERSGIAVGARIRQHEGDERSRRQMTVLIFTCFPKALEEHVEQ
jgi:hypothetical protein